MEIWSDPILRAPLWGTLLFSISSAWIGVVMLLQKRSLLPEALSHAAYPGVAIGATLFALLCPEKEEWLFLPLVAGGALFALLGLWLINFLERRRGVSPDAALAFCLSLFFGAGVTWASWMQKGLPLWHRQIQLLLFGQAATLTDLHVAAYGIVTGALLLFFSLSFYPLQSLLFDRTFARSQGIAVPFFERLFFALLLLSLILGVRSVGILLLSGMAIAPAVAARQYSDSLFTLFLIAPLFGAASALLGNLLSLTTGTLGENLQLPTGPLILLVATAFALLSLLFAPKRGRVVQMARILSYRIRCLKENLLKSLWKKGEAPLSELSQGHHRLSKLLVLYALWKMKRGGWIAPFPKWSGPYSLTEDGKARAAQIVRLHRLFELYLASSLGFKGAIIHRTAEEMEHILTPEMEERLTHLLAHPTRDPHQQPIPERPRPLTSEEAP